MQNTKHYDEHILFVDCGVATTKQVSECIKQAILDAEEVLEHSTNCRFKVNLIVGKKGEYFGFGYIYVSSSEIYWMLLGRNADGTERIEEFPDPDWTPPVDCTQNKSKDDTKTKDPQGSANGSTQGFAQKTWIDIVEEEDAKIQPIIKRALPPLVTIPGYKYDEDQLAHLREISNNQDIPEMGYFEISRGYATDAPQGRIKHRLHARNVPDWITEAAFKSIFSPYTSDTKKEGTVRLGNESKTDKYPIISFLNPKHGGRIVFISFDPLTKDAIFALLMTKKLSIVCPTNTDLRATLIFTHAYDNN